jgi:hypothetical protein
MYQDEAIEFVKQYSFIDVASDKNGASNKFKTLYFNIFGIIPPCGGCSKSRPFYKEIENYSITGLIPEKMSNKSRFRLKDGAQPYCADLHTYLMKDTLTDDEAVVLIASSAGAKQFFDIMPDTVDQEVENYKANAAKSAAQKEEAALAAKAAEQARIDEAAAKLKVDQEKAAADAAELEKKNTEEAQSQKDKLADAQKAADAEKAKAEKAKAEEEKAAAKKAADVNSGK